MQLKLSNLQTALKKLEDKHQLSSLHYLELAVVLEMIPFILQMHSFCVN